MVPSPGCLGCNQTLNLLPFYYIATFLLCIHIWKEYLTCDHTKWLMTVLTFSGLSLYFENLISHTFKLITPCTSYLKCAPFYNSIKKLFTKKSSTVPKSHFNSRSLKTVVLNSVMFSLKTPLTFFLKPLSLWFLST